jgi:hypothetical protein
VLPGDSFELELRQLNGPVRIILCEGGLQIDYSGADESRSVYAFAEERGWVRAS